MDLTTEDILKAITGQQKPQQLPMQKQGMPGPNDILGMAQNITSGIPEYAKDLFGRMKRGVTEGPYSSPTGEYDPSIGLLGPELMTGAFGAAPGVGAAGGRFRGGLGGTQWGYFTKEVREAMQKISERLGDVPDKVRAKAFRERFPDYRGSDSSIRRQFTRNETRAQDFNPGVLKEDAPIGDSPFSTAPMGKFEGKNKLNTDSPGLAIANLQEKSDPVTKQWLREWASQAGANITEKRSARISPTGAERNSNRTSYFDISDPANPKNVATVRVPGDRGRHSGWSRKNKGGSYFDTGLPVGDELKTGNMARDVLEDNLINQAGMPYANKEALQKALELKLSKSAPMGDFRLVSEDFSPRITPPKMGTPPNPYKDPRQLQLLSGGFTPAHILEILRQQNGQAQ